MHKGRIKDERLEKRHIYSKAVLKYQICGMKCRAQNKYNHYKYISQCNSNPNRGRNILTVHIEDKNKNNRVPISVSKITKLCLRRNLTPLVTGSEMNMISH